MASVARQPARSSSMMARVDRVDLVLSYLEEMHAHHGRSNSVTSSPSTAAAGTGTGTDDSSAASTPRGSWSSSWRRASCRPAKEALQEAQAKGTLIDRIAFLEDRLLKMEEDMEITPEKSVVTDDRSSLHRHHHGSRSSKKKNKGLKSLVKSCVVGKLKTKD
ncbi:hypothetical protein ACP4OV_022695 [Aristida adscensionis]